MANAAITKTVCDFLENVKNNFPVDIFSPEAEIAEAKGFIIVEVSEALARITGRQVVQTVLSNSGRAMLDTCADAGDEDQEELLDVLDLIHQGRVEEAKSRDAFARAVVGGMVSQETIPEDVPENRLVFITDLGLDFIKA